MVSISGNNLTEQAKSSVAETLTGRLAGVQVLSTEGSPDADINIRIRGNGSLTQDSSPLIIVDGFPVNSMNDISPTDIESISVLKDASSTAIYGSRGANGVIIITTKDGRSGEISVNFNTFYGFQKIAKTLDVLGPEDYVKWQYEYALLRDSENLDSYERYFGLWQDYDQYVGQEGNNWQKQIYGNMGEVQSHDIAIRGGSEKASFNFNYAHYDVNTIMLGSDYKRDNLSLALKSQAGEKVDLSFTVRYSETEINGGGTNEQNEISSADIVDQAASVAERSVELRTVNRQIKLISKIDKALDRIKNKTYGFCEDTGEPIGLKRLIARPIAILSIEAQERHENKEKIFADN